MAPCLFLELYQSCTVLLQSNELFEEGATALKSDFTSLLFSVYDIHRPQDVRLLEVFLLEMLKYHIRSTNNANDIMGSGSLEWQIFTTVLNSHKSRRLLRDVMKKPLEDLAASMETLIDPTKVLRDAIGLANDYRLRQALDILFNLTSSLYTTITTTAVGSIMEVMQWMVDLMTRAFKSQNRLDNGVIGRRVVKALASIAVKEMDERRAIEKERTFVEHNRLSVDTEEFVLSALTDSETFQEYVQQRYTGLDMAKLQKHVFDFWNDRSRQRALDNFVGWCEQRKSKEQKASEMAGDVKERTASREDLDKHKSLLKDLLLSRSQYQRRVVQVDHSARKLLIAMDYLKVLQDDEALYTTGTKNARVDVFHTDTEKGLSHCSRCRLFHPPVEYQMKEQRTESTAFRKGRAGAARVEVESKIAEEAIMDADPFADEVSKGMCIIDAQECSNLWRVLRDEVSTPA